METLVAQDGIEHGVQKGYRPGQAYRWPRLYRHRYRRRPFQGERSEDVTRSNGLLAYGAGRDDHIRVGVFRIVSERYPEAAEELLRPLPPFLAAGTPDLHRDHPQVRVEEPHQGINRGSPRHDGERTSPRQLVAPFHVLQDPYGGPPLRGDHRKSRRRILPKFRTHVADSPLEGREAREGTFRTYIERDPVLLRIVDEIPDYQEIINVAHVIYDI